MKLLTTSLILLQALLVVSCDRGNDARSGGQDFTRVPVAVVVAKKTRTHLTILKATRLESRVDIQLVAEGTGRVMKRLVTEGDEVRAGATVIQLHDAAQVSDVKAAAARLFSLRTSSAPLAEQREGEAQHEKALEMLRRQTVTAPRNGLLDRYHVEAGDHVVMGTPVARLVDPERLFCIAAVIEDEILLVDTEAEASLAVTALPGQSFKGRVVHRAVGPLRGTSLYEVEVDVDSDPRLRPGFTGNLSLVLRSDEPQLLVPRDAVLMRHGQERVFVVEGDGESAKAVERAVSVRRVPGRPTVVNICSGVENGERIIVRGDLGLSNGTPVAIRKQ